jgi:hypothetical protein
MAPIQQITKLVKTFENGKTVITETLSKGRVFTQVLDKDGKLLLERLKVVSEPVKVGKRNVIHTDRIVRDNYQNVWQNATDRVYNVADGKNIFAGMRDISKHDGMYNKEIILPKENEKYRLKQTLIGLYDANIRAGERIDCVDFFILDSHKRHRNIYGGSDEVMQRHFNNLGLPIPGDKLGNIKISNEVINNKKLSEMRKYFQRHYPEKQYTSWPGMEKLNEPVIDRVSELSKYLV